MKKFIAGFVASFVLGLVVVLYYFLYYRRDKDEATIEVINRDLREKIERNSDEFEAEVKIKTEEIRHAREDEIVAKVHSYFGLDS